MHHDSNFDISYSQEPSESFYGECQLQQSSTLPHFKKEAPDLPNYHLQITRVDPQSDENTVTELIEHFRLPFMASHMSLNLNELLCKIEEEGNFHF